jgi:nucleotide-binding universal stress UspA family protein
MDVKIIMVPLDGSELAERALAPAAELARDASATLVLVRATEAPVMYGADPTEAQVTVVREAEVYLDKQARRLRREGVARVETSVWYGPAAPSLVEAARRRKVDLIVMSSHGRSGLGRLVLGSVAESVLRATTTSILLVRAPSAPVETPARTAEPREAKETLHA